MTIMPAMKRHLVSEQKLCLVGIYAGNRDPWTLGIPTAPGCEAMNMTKEWEQAKSM
jgi:hypothetical protein